jgi:hypothetical protein
MGWYERMQRRWKRRYGGGSWAVSESVRIDGVTAHEVWDLIRPAESAVTLTDGVVRAYTESGTEGGVGEVQVFVQLVDGSEVEHRIMVVEEAPPFLARTRCLCPDHPGVTSYELTEVDHTAELCVSISIDLPVGQVLSPEFEEVWRGFIVSYLERVRSTLEGASA